MLRKRSKALLSAITALMLLSLMLMEAPGAAAQGALTRGDSPIPIGLSDIALADSTAASAKLSPQLSEISGRVSVVVRLSKSPAALMPDELAQGDAVDVEQDEIIARIGQIDSSARVLGRVKILLNALILEMDSAKLNDLAQDVRVVTVNPVVNFQLDLSETVPYIGASPDVQRSANGGAGVTVAVLDSGIDYTHAAFGGPGTPEAYMRAYGNGPGDPLNTTLDGLFPTAKVVGGYDFIGEAWPDGKLAPDPDPIDYDGHGTHVADIIAGAVGVAPGASLYAVKVCSAVARSCNGAALILGMEYAVDPNGDGRTNDHVDIVNMSLGSAYNNSYFDDLSNAVQQADRLGVLTVASAGNGGDRPYIVGTPSSAPAALSVAETQAPSAKAYPLQINLPLSMARPYSNTATLEWAPIRAGFTGDVVYLGRGCKADTYRDNPVGKVALIDRTDSNGLVGCSISEKVARASAAGAIGVLIALTAPGDALTFSNGGECPVIADSTCVPALVITQIDANRLKVNLNETVNVTVSDAQTIPLVGSIVGSSSRGPSTGESFPQDWLHRQYGQLIKPEIGAPGTSVSALVGTGDRTSAFSGTSSSAPMVAGAAALLIANSRVAALPKDIKSWMPSHYQDDKHYRLGRITPREIKARLMNTAETNIYLNPATLPGILAPITRIGNGELRVDRALAAGAAAWELNGAGGSLSFGMVDVSQDNLKIYRTVAVKNYTRRSITYSIGSTFRYADDQENGAVTITPSRNRITIPPYRTRYLLVTVEISGAKLRPWMMNSGLYGGDSAYLNQLEYDGYLTFTDQKNANNNLHMAWHVLPRISPDVRISTETTAGGTTPFTLKNRGVGSGSYYALPLLGENPTAPELADMGSRDPNITARYVGAVSSKSPVQCSKSGLMLQFGVQTWQQVTHANYPLEIRIYLDTNRDGVDDYVVYTSEMNGQTSFANDGRNATYAGPVGGEHTARFLTEHGTNSGAFLLTVCGEQVGLTAEADAGKIIDVEFSTVDNYLTGNVASSISTSMRILGERYTATDTTGAKHIGPLDVAANIDAAFAMSDAGDNDSSEQGLLLLNVKGGKTESLVISSEGATGPHRPPCYVGHHHWWHHCYWRGGHHHDDADDDERSFRYSGDR